jgi:multidrug efflux pump subunit AcrA (membrane-fusion protein)
MNRAYKLLAGLLLAALLAGCGGDIAPGQGEASDSGYEPESTAQAVTEEVRVFSEAVGTVRARTDIRVEAQITARVLEVNVTPGTDVGKGDTLVVLDARAAESRLEQARQRLESARSGRRQAQRTVAAAQAAFNKAKSTYERMKKLRSEQVITEEEVEQAETAYLQARAELNRAQAATEGASADVEQAEKAVQEAEISLDYTTITAQEAGEVAKRFVDPGDLAFPGKQLLTLQTGGSLRMEAQVREGLIGRLQLGQRVPVVVEALKPQERLEGIVEEIEPLADPTTRSFVVKASVPERPGLYPGMFGRLLVPMDMRAAVMIPEEAVTRVGQLETVMIRTPDGWQRVHVRTGEQRDGLVEVLSGLEGGETVGIGGPGA